MKSRIALFDNTIPQLFHQLDRIKRHTSVIFFFRIRKHRIRHHVRSLFLLVIPLRSISPSFFLTLVGPDFMRIFSNVFTQFNQISAQFNIFQINGPRIIIQIRHFHPRKICFCIIPCRNKVILGIGRTFLSCCRIIKRHFLFIYVKHYCCMISNFLLAIFRQPATIYHNNRIMSGLEGTYDTVNTGTITAHHNQSALFEQAAYTMQRSSPLPQPTVIPGLLREFIRIIFNLSTFQNKLLTLEITKITFRFGCHLRHWQEVRFFIISSHHGIQLLRQDKFLLQTFISRQIFKYQSCFFSIRLTFFKSSQQFFGYHIFIFCFHTSSYHS